MRKFQMYDNLGTSQLSRITRERGLEKPDVQNAGEWAAWLREQDHIEKGGESTPAQGIAPPEQTTDYDTLTRDAVIALAIDAGMDVTSRTTKMEAIDFLQAADGMTEEEQAAQHHDSED